MSIKIIIPGALTTVQDRGRFGNMATGFTESGAADADAFKTANILVGNDINCAAFEMTLMGMGVQFLSDSVIALTGAEMALHINGTIRKSYKAYAIKKGDYVYCSPAKSGCRSYLAVKGGIKTEPVLGSRSTSLKLKLGGFSGRQLKPGDIIPTDESFVLPENLEKRELSQPSFEKNVTLRAIAGPQDDMFTENGINHFFNDEFKVSPTSDRMGIRLSGEPVETKNGSDIISDGIVSGSVQIPKDGNPIILIADHQTTGGYAKLATVISVDISKAAQLTPGCTVKFSRVTPKEAEKLYKEHNKYFLKLLKKFK